MSYMRMIVYSQVIQGYLDKKVYIRTYIWEKNVNSVIHVF